MWICPKCKNENKDIAIMCSASKCSQIQPGKSLSVFSGGTSEEAPPPPKRQYKNSYRPVINLQTGKGYLATPRHAEKLEKSGTHKLAGDIVTR